jgi:hypothetical protein
MSEEISKYEKDMHEYLGSIRDLCAKGFTDFIVIGIDVTGEAAKVFQVGDLGKNSISNRDRIVRMVGELEDTKFNLQFGSFEDYEEEIDEDEKDSSEDWL